MFVAPKFDISNNIPVNEVKEGIFFLDHLLLNDPG